MGRVMGRAPMSGSSLATWSVAQVDSLRALLEPTNICATLAPSAIVCCTKRFARPCVRHIAVWAKNLLVGSCHWLFLSFALAFVRLLWLLLVLLLLHLLRELALCSTLLLLLLLLLARHMSNRWGVLHSSRRRLRASLWHGHKEESDPRVCHKRGDERVKGFSAPGVWPHS